MIEPETVFLKENPDVFTTNILVTVKGYLQDDGNVQLIVEGLFGSDELSTYEETYKLEKTYSLENPKHVFELGYPFTPNEVYQVTVINGEASNTIEWVSPPITQKEPEKEEPSSERVTSEKSSETNQVVTNALIQQAATIQGTSEDANIVQSLMEENELLRQEIEKKDAVILEQLKVIQNLASKISNTISNESTGKLYFVVDTSDDFVQSLMEENELLRQEIEKKDAVILEQLKVIQNLAEMVRNAIFVPTLNYFSIV